MSGEIINPVWHWVCSGTDRVVRRFGEENPKSQVPNKSQVAKTKMQKGLINAYSISNFGLCSWSLLGSWVLGLGALDFFSHSLQGGVQLRAMCVPSRIGAIVWFSGPAMINQ